MKKIKNYLKRKIYNKTNKKFNHINSTQFDFKDLQDGKIVLGKHIYIGKDIMISGNVEISDYTYFSDGLSEINAELNKIKIGKYCSIARNFFPRTSSHYINRLTTHPFIYKYLGLDEIGSVGIGNITIGNDVWIGANVTILGNVTIGDGAIIGAGSVVTKDVPPYSINVGSPSKTIKYRFDEQTIKKLLKIQWWDKSIEELKDSKEIFLLDININRKALEKF